MIIAHSKSGDIKLTCNQLIPNDLYVDMDRTIVIDLLNIFLEIYVADISIKRLSNQPRKIVINTYVDSKNYNLWIENLELIERLANYVTDGDGDEWKLNVIPAEYEFGTQQLTFINTQADNISLLSGGLDSFCGAYFNEIGNRNTMYCGYKTNNIDTSAINCVYNFLKNRTGIAGMRVFSKVEQKKITHTQKTRSMLFFSLAIMIATKEKIDTVNIYENGIMTLNPSFQSRGTTKTTHPKTIYLYQTLLDNVGIKIKLNHPFLFCTKGEIVNSLSIEYKKYIVNTRSCSRSMQDNRYDLSTRLSCGTCVP